MSKCKPCPATEAIERLQQLERIYGTLQDHTETMVVNSKRVERARKIRKS
jgi:hypothetical protein